MTENTTRLLAYATGELARAAEQIGRSASSINQYLRLHPYDDKAVGEQVQEQLKPYFDPDNERAVLIQLASKDAYLEIELFLVTSNDVLKKYAAAFEAAEQWSRELTAAGAALLAELRERRAEAGELGQELLATALSGSSVEHFRDDVDALLNEGTQLQREQALLLFQGLVVLQTLAKAMHTIDVLLTYRAQVLAEFFKTAPAGTVPSNLRALVDAIAEDGTLTVAEHVLVEIVGMVPVANIVMSAARIGLELTSKIKKIKDRHKRGVIDDMLDLSTDMTAVREALEVAAALFEKVSELANAKPSSNLARPSR